MKRCIQKLFLEAVVNKTFEFSKLSQGGIFRELDVLFNQVDRIYIIRSNIFRF